MSDALETYEVTIRPATAPDGGRGVLLQLPDGYVLVGPGDAEELAARLVQAAAQVRESGE